jgi:hypothetical protein
VPDLPAGRNLITSDSLRGEKSALFDRVNEPRHFRPAVVGRDRDVKLGLDCFIIRDADGQQVAFLNSGGSLFGYASPSLANGLAHTGAALGILRAG